MTRAANTAKTSPARLWLTLFALFAFTLQAYVTQSHVHPAAAVADKQVPGKIPSGDDQANCPACQAALHGGHYLTPAAGGFVPLMLVTCGIAIATGVATIVHAVSHGWNSRGPPLI